MLVTVLCESMFGNTERLAEQVRDGLVEAGAEVRLVEVGTAQPIDFEGVDLLVLAAPTHALTLSRPESRADAVARGAEPRRARFGIREWLRDVGRYVPDDRARPLVAVLDTRVSSARHWPGSAAHRAARILRRQGFEVIGRASFYVEALTGPLAEGDEARAREWGRELLARAAATTGAA